METIISVAVLCLFVYGLFTLFYFINKAMTSNKKEETKKDEVVKNENHSAKTNGDEITNKHILGAIIIFVAMILVVKYCEDDNRKESRSDYRKSYAEKSETNNSKDELIYKFVRDTKRNLPIDVDECTTLVALMYASDVLTMKYEVSDDIVNLIDDEFVDIQKGYLINSTKEIIKMIGLPRSIKNLTFNYVYYSENGELLAIIPIKLSEL